MLRGVPQGGVQGSVQAVQVLVQAGGERVSRLRCYGVSEVSMSLDSLPGPSPRALRSLVY
eukprot:4210012-Alexandrium_andersonii.AAC.1